MSRLKLNSFLPFQMLLQHLCIVLVQDAPAKVLFQLTLLNKVIGNDYVLFYVVVLVGYLFGFAFLFGWFYPSYWFEEWFQDFLATESDAGVLRNGAEMDESTVEIFVADLYTFAYFIDLLTAHCFTICLKNAVYLHFEIEWSST